MRFRESFKAEDMGAVTAVLAELENEAALPNPVPHRINALLVAAASLIEATANVPQAYGVLKAAAALAGVTLP